MTTRPTYLERLAARSAATNTVLCLGLDPDPTALPPGFRADLAGVERFATLIAEAAAPFAAAIKPNLAFFEAFGAAGLAALERIRGSLPADLPVVADAKRGDIGTTAARQAVALFDGLGADAVTVNPYLGGEAIIPLLERTDRFAYVLCRTSNPGAGELQDLVVAADDDDRGARPRRSIVAWHGWRGRGVRVDTVGLVVGATAPAELAAIRAIAPGLAFLVPGRREPRAARSDRSSSTVGRRSTPAGGRPGGGLLVNVSRGISGAATAADDGAQRDPFERVAEAAAEWARRLPVLP